MIETKNKEIDGATYSVTQMTARRALRMQTKLIRIFGASLAEIFLPSDQEPMDGATFSKNDAVSALKNLALEIDEITCDKIIVELLSGVRKDGVELTEQVLDLEFAGKLDTLFKVVWFVLEVNYSSFFGEGGIGNILKQQTPPKKRTMKNLAKK